LTFSYPALIKGQYTIYQINEIFIVYLYYIITKEYKIAILKITIEYTNFDLIF